MNKVITFPDESKFELLFCVEHPDQSFHVKYKDNNLVQELFVPKDFISNEK